MGAGQSFEQGSRAGQLAIITGGAAGIGFGAAEKAMWLGMTTVVADIEPTALADAVRRLQAGCEGGNACTGVVVDVSDEASVQALAAHPAVAGSAIRFLFLNAGVHNGEASFEATAADFRWLLSVNVEGVAHGLRTFTPKMLAQAERCAICTTSSAAGINTTQTGPYSISKTAVRVLTEQLYHDVAANGGDHIQVHCLFPAFVVSDLTWSERNRPDGLLDDGEGRVNSGGRELTDEGMRRGKEKLSRPDYMQQMNAETPAEMATTLMQGVADNRFYVLGGKDGGSSIRESAARRADAIVNDLPPPFGGGFSSDANKEKFAKLQQKDVQPKL